LPPADFHPQGLGDLLTPEGAALLQTWYIDMYDYLILVDDLAPLISVSRRRRAAILDRAAAGDDAAIDEMIAILVGDVADGRDPSSPAVRDFLALVVRAMSPARPLPWNDVPDEPADWPELKVGLWEGLFLRDPYYNGPSDDSILQDILHARPEPLALGASCFDPRARGVVWDLRGDVPRPVDYCAPIDTHFNLDFVRAAQRAHSRLHRLRKGMNGEERRTDLGHLFGGAGDGVRDVVELQIKKDLLAAFDQILSEPNPAAIGQLQPDLVKAHCIAEFGDHGFRRFGIGEIERHNQAVAGGDVGHGLRPVRFYP
jgi:hypothetical protein